mmetsp:Transcript_15162/g.41941  ORF Transcript_15162/g.41941 Transcript_15162/m.41941 type:complete len:245 (+) Transcript_15162:80-814(+)
MATLPSSAPVQQMHFADPSMKFPMYANVMLVMPGDVLLLLTAFHKVGFVEKDPSPRTWISRSPPSAHPINSIPSEYVRHWIATPTETAAILRMAPSISSCVATLPVENPVNNCTLFCICVHRTTEHGPEPRFAVSLWMTTFTPSQCRFHTQKLPSAHPAAMTMLLSAKACADTETMEESASNSSASGSRLIDTVSPVDTVTDQTLTVASQLPLIMMCVESCLHNTDGGLVGLRRIRSSPVTASR